MKEKIAIVGIGCVFPDAMDFTEYWRNIIEGKDSVRDISGEFWEASDFYDTDPKAPDKCYTTKGAIVDEVEFDSMEFGISPMVMQSTCTEQLFSLIAARQALIDAGLYGKNAKAFNKEKTGVIISAPTGKNAFELSHRSEAPKIHQILISNGIPKDVADRVVEKYKSTLGEWTEDNNPGYIPNVVAGRIANRFDLGGTSCSVDAACASSLASLKFAIDELQNGNCDIMLAGGANLDVSATAFISFCKTPAISKKGKITPFDAAADGMILGDGVGIVVLKRLSDAKRDRDKIYAVVRGVGSSGDGRAKSIYAPSKEGQIRALRRAYENAQVEPETIGLIEAHGTGTAAGDACEISAISEVYHKDNHRRDTIIGSVKSQIGHLRMAAGVAGFIKVALALHEKVLPASLHMSTPNPTLLDSNLCVLSKPKAWIINDSQPVRRGAVSAFGFGGTNYHIVLEEADSDYEEAYRITPSPIGVMFSASTKEELVEKIKALLQGMESDPRLWYQDTYRYHKFTENSVRLAFVVKSAAEVKEKCNKALNLLQKNTQESWVQGEITYSAKRVKKDAKTAILFSGQGTQELDMLSEIAMGYPQMRQAITKADNVMLVEKGTPVSQLVYPNYLTEEEKKEAREHLQCTANTQPVLATMEAGLYEIAKSRGLSSDFLIGHSFGELVALWADGVFDYDALIRIAKKRGFYMNAVIGDTAMSAVMADKQTVANYIKEFEHIYMANENSSSQTVVSGDRIEIEQLEKKLEKNNVSVVRLKVSGAFHSPYMKEAAKDFREFLSSQKIESSSGKVIANYDGKPYPMNGSEKIADILQKQLVNPVLFQTSIVNAYKQGARVFVEVGSGKVLSNLTKNILEGKECQVITLCPDKNKDSMVQFEFAMAQLAVLGFDIADDKYRVLQNEEFIQKKTKTSYSVNEEVFVLPKFRKVREDGVKPDEKATKKNLESMAIAVEQAGIGVAAKTPVEKVVQEEKTMSVEKTTPVEKTVQVVQTKESFNKGNKTMTEVKSIQALNADVFTKFMDAQTSQLEAVTNMLKISQAKTETEKKNVIDCISLFQNNSLKALQTYFASQTGMEISMNETYIPETTVTETTVVQETLIEPVVKETPVESVEKETKKNDKNIAELVLTIVSDKTGYPTDMLDTDMELESDLGIDSIKRVEILTEIHEQMGEIFTAEDVANLSTKGSISEIVEYLESMVGTAVSADASTKTDESSSVEKKSNNVSVEKKSNDSIEKVVLEAISHQTGYPMNMLDVEMELEKDCGIDLVKRAEVFSEVCTALNCSLTPDEITEMSELSNIQSIVAYFSEKI